MDEKEIKISEQINNLEHNESARTELDDTTEQYTPYGIDLIDVKEIKLDTQEGRFDYLTSIVENSLAVRSERLKVLESGFYEHICEAEPIFRDLDSAGVDSLEENTRKDLDLISAQKRILENLDFSNSSVIQALKTQSEQYYNKAMADGMSQTAAEKFLLMHEAADNLYLIMVDEVKQRKQQNETAKAETQGEVIDSTLSQEAMKDVQTIEPEGKPIASYSIEGGLVDSPITVLIGQEIPDDWFNSKNVEEKNDSGFGISIERPAPIKDYLQSILNTEYAKIDEGERQHYDYSSISKKIMEEAQRTKKIPDVAAILKSSELNAPR